MIPRTMPPSTLMMAPCTKAASAAGQPDQVDIGDIDRVAQAAQRNFGFHIIQDFFGHLLDHFGGDEARANGIDADVLAAELARPDFGHADDAGLGGDVVGLAEVAVQARRPRRH